MSNNTADTVANQVKNRKDAEAVVLLLLQTYSSDTAWDRVSFVAKERKKSPGEVARQTVRNLFTTFSTNRYSK